MRIDVVTQLDGVDFAQASRDAKQLKLFGRTVPVISLEHLILNKRTSGRPKDMADLSELEALKKR